MSPGDSQGSSTKASKNYLEDVLALNEVTVEVAGGVQFKEQLRNSTPFGLFVPFCQKSFRKL